MIKICDRTRPFSRVPGTVFPIPYSLYGIQVFPAAIYILPKNKLVSLKIKGPVVDFIAQLDLERGFLSISGKGVEGYFHYFIFSLNDQLCFFQKKGAFLLPDSADFKIVDELPQIDLLERLSFGFTKTLDWDLVKRRGNLEEILPVWFRLGQMFPEIPLKHVAPSLLQVLQNTVGFKKETFEDLFLAGFSGIFYPKIDDDYHLGYALKPLGLTQNPFSILREGYKKIRSLFFIENPQNCTVLPSILSHFPCGKITGIKTAFGIIDMEWTKYHLRQMAITCLHSKKIAFKFPKTHKSCRLTSDFNLKASLDLNCTLDLRSGTKYFLSHFQE